MPNLPGFGNEATMPAQYSVLVGRVLQYCEWATEGLTRQQFNDTFEGKTNSIAFDIWHVVRTVDNIIHFVFEREQPVWLRDSFHEQWGLPKVDQGTGMDPDAAYTLPFPEPAEFDRYTKAVADAVVPRLAGMSMEYLAATQFIRPWGDVPRMEAIGHGLIGHGNGHLGRASLARNLFGLKGLPF
jgi:hypothetical protein